MAQDNNRISISCVREKLFLKHHHNHILPIHCL